MWCDEYELVEEKNLTTDDNLKTIKKQMIFILSSTGCDLIFSENIFINHL